MIWRQLLTQARQDASSWIGDALAHRREHPGVYALAHAYAATHYRLEAEDARRARRPLAARWLAFRAMVHRQRRRHFERMAAATAEAARCSAMMDAWGGGEA